MEKQKWIPLEKGRLDEIRRLFGKIYPENEYGGLGADIGDFWVGLLEKSWEGKDEELRRLDLAYDPSDPLSRIQQKTTIIAYADSISREGEKSLETLDRFFKKRLPAIGGLHVLPACTVVEDRFNDGYFSQVERDNIHSSFGDNSLFADIMHRYFSMNDLVLGHVDIENPVFQDYLAGHDDAGKKFYVFSMEEYESLKAAGSFSRVFRPRPFPLFTIFRRLPAEMPYRTLSHGGRVDVMQKLIQKMRGISIDSKLVSILWLFNKLKNDQMLLDEDYVFIPGFMDWLEENNISRDDIFTLSLTQEVQHPPYILRPEIDVEEKLLLKCGFSREQAESVAEIFRETESRIFGEEIRALTTFSHVQVDVNTTTFEGLKALATDLVWYLTMDLNMLRLDAVNYAFKKWGTSCFGLPELDLLMKIIYLSMDCISPRMVPNLEVNDSLTTILKQMSSIDSPPPMMHDFHLASLMPAVFHSKDPSILARIFSRIKEFDIPHSSIRFSLSESHDGKSVRGSMDLLTYHERMVLTKAVKANGGFVKYKAIPVRECRSSEFEQYCSETGLDYSRTAALIFDEQDSGSALSLKQGLDTLEDIYRSAAGILGKNETADFYFTRLIDGREPYELCITTRDSLPAIEDRLLEASRFLSFETLSFAVMGRNVKTVYFNDLLGLPNDYKRVEETGELRNIKRTKVKYDEIEAVLQDESAFESIIARGMNNLIALVDYDPAMNFRGGEAEVLDVPDRLPVAAVLNRCGESVSLAIVNLSAESAALDIPLQSAGFPAAGGLYDNISGQNIETGNGSIKVLLEPYGRMWLTRNAVDIPPEKLVQEN